MAAIRVGPTIAFLAWASVAQAQDRAAANGAGTSLGVRAQGLVSVQPVNDAYVGSPYLNQGLGGAVPGVAIGFDAVTGRRVAFAVEFSTTQSIAVEQTGRLVSGTGRSRIRDSLAVVQVGYAAGQAAKLRVSVLGGAAIGGGVPSIDDVPVDRDYGPGAGVNPAAREGHGSLGLSAGVDVSRSVSGRIDWVASARYALLPRSRRATELGVGHHVFRFGAGLRIRVRS